MKKRMLIIFAAAALALFATAAFSVLGKTWIFFDEDGCSEVKTTSLEAAGMSDGATLVNPDGTSVGSRFYTPAGYERTVAEEGSFAQYLRSAVLLPDKSVIRNYDGSESANPCSAVFAFDVGNADVQQCADSVIRMYSEYLYSHGEYDKISFLLSNGMEMSYSDWCAGKRLMAVSDFACLVKLAPSGNSYESFRRYLAGVMNYAGTKSLAAQSKKITPDEFTVGDILLIPGSPGHVVMAVDEAENESGSKCWLLAQGYMPAQSFHVLVNPAHENDMWYYEEEMEDTIYTSPCRFNTDCMYRFAE